MITDQYKRHSESLKLLNTLYLWEHALAAGHHDRDIEAFTFRHGFLNHAECKLLKRKLFDRSDCKTHHNCVRLKDGRICEIPLIPRPANLGDFQKFVEDHITLEEDCYEVF